MAQKNADKFLSLLQIYSADGSLLRAESRRGRGKGRGGGGAGSKQVSFNHFVRLLILFISLILVFGLCK